MATPMDAAVRASSEHRFYTGMAVAIVATVFVGFARSFFLHPLFPEWPVPPEPIFAVHGVAFTAWIALLVTQAMLVARGRTDLHRKLGVLGVALAVAMVVLGTLGALVAARRPTGFIDIPVPPLQFLIVPLSALALFALFVALAIARRRDPQSHKRLMLLASIQLVTAAIARWPMVMDYGPPAYFGLTDLFVVAIAVRDYRTRGALHPATLWGGMLAIAMQPAQLMASGTQAWLAVARWLTGLLG